MVSKELLAAIKTRAFKKGEFVLSSGKKSSYYIDVKKAYAQPEVLKAIAVEMASLIRGQRMDRIAGVAVGAVPLATALSLESGLPFLIIRKEKKGYGTEAQVEGECNAGERVVIVEDVTTTGGSVLSAIEALRSRGCLVDKVLAVVDREEGARENLARRGVTLVPLITVKELLFG